VGLQAVQDRLLAKGYRFGTLKRPFGYYFDMLYFDLAGFEGVSQLCIVPSKASPERLVFASDYPQDFTGVNTDTGKGIQELRNYIDTIRKLPLNDGATDAILGRTSAGLLKL
jgi:aminocarboxymuconate-semialdehyde decarboxylase